MIYEITNFVDSIPANYHTDGLKPSPGMHIIIDLNQDGNLNQEGYKSYIIDKKGIISGLVYNKLVEVDCDFDFGIREYHSAYIDMNKALDLPAKRIHSTVPYIIKVKKENLQKIESSFENYFNNCKKYYDEDCFELVEQIINFSKNHLKSKINNDPILNEIDNKSYIIVYFAVDMKNLIKSHNAYLSSKLFLKDDFNIESGGDVYGVSGFLNGANTKKPFIMHQTSIYKNGINNRISKNNDIAIKLFQFETLLKNKKLPNIIPIFIDKEELNKEFVRIYSRDNTLTFRDIIRQLFEQRQEDISNYYLINWSNRNGIIINDIDYVTKFRFYIDNFVIENSMQIPNKQVKDKIANVFDFEVNVVQKIFNNALVVKTKKNSILFKYFDEIDPKYTTAVNFQNVLKYRKNFYDFIYKSKEDVINKNNFFSLLISGIINDIKHDGFNGKSTEWNIKEKLNILFSLNKKFDKQNKNFGGIDMASKIPEFQETTRKLFNDNDYHIQTDEEFAFVSGQLIYYILTKSEASNKTHSLLEPFITKNDSLLFKQTITRGIEQYKHSFEFGSRRFEKLTSEILGYNCLKGIKEMMPIILAGYFSKSLIFEKSKEKEGVATNVE